MPLPLCSQVLGFIAKGSYGPILKVKDIFKDEVFAVKVSSEQYRYNYLKKNSLVIIFFDCCFQVLPKSEVVKNGVVEQLKEEVIIQVLRWRNTAQRKRQFKYG